jgi:DTW domain-containing protein YfiP
MARDLCLQCQRPIIACICSFILKTENKIKVLVLQHPSEVTQTKGTVALLQRSLKHCQVIIGENFTEHDELNLILSHYQALLLYPSKEADTLAIDYIIPNTSVNSEKPLLLIIIDGTWKKAYRMFMLSKNLHSLAQICLPESIANSGLYLIRKVAKKNALSSLEATCYALALLEGELSISMLNIELGESKYCIDAKRYQPLLNKFSQFNQFQLSFRK